VPGIVAGLGLLDSVELSEPAGQWRAVCTDGDYVTDGEPIVEITGNAWELALAEDHVLGPIGVASGIAQRGLSLHSATPAGLRLACGGWKKLPAAMKPVLRAGLDVAGISHRLVDGEFVYIDKNVVRLLGGVDQAVRAGRVLNHGAVAVQVADAQGALTAVEAGASIVMVDTGTFDVLATVTAALCSAGRREDVTLAFAGGVTKNQLAAAHQAGADIVDIGRYILDAPLWDLHVEVVT
jgi:nicotinate-nucleotide pyrophosphorylase (carboxylating)